MNTIFKPGDKVRRVTGQMHGTVIGYRSRHPDIAVVDYGVTLDIVSEHNLVRVQTPPKENIFKPGDRVRHLGTGTNAIGKSSGIVVNYRAGDPSMVVVEFGELFDIVHEGMLAHVQTPPKVSLPYNVYDDSGYRDGSYGSVEDAVYYTRNAPSLFILDVCSGQWYDNQGQEITK